VDEVVVEVHEVEVHDVVDEVEDEVEAVCLELQSTSLRNFFTYYSQYVD
jgi:hypothetical protein